ncbi:hypothetical protein MRX96_035899 [Rhipicephalus microplus]
MELYGDSLWSKDGKLDITSAPNLPSSQQAPCCDACSGRFSDWKVSDYVASVVFGKVGKAWRRNDIFLRQC